MTMHVRNRPAELRRHMAGGGSRRFPDTLAPSFVVRAILNRSVQKVVRRMPTESAGFERIRDASICRDWMPSNPPATWQITGPTVHSGQAFPMHCWQRSVETWPMLRGSTQCPSGTVGPKSGSPVADGRRLEAVLYRSQHCFTNPPRTSLNSQPWPDGHAVKRSTRDFFSNSLFPLFPGSYR